MELVFHKENGLYITEFEVTSDFNVHLERSKGGKVSFYQKTTDGNYDHIEKLSKNIDKVFDYDFQALVYPKIIKITSECEFDVASLTTDGEVTEIKSQSKEVEITSNGVTEIAPDAGFGYLSGVKVNVNVPQSGGSGGGGGAASGGGDYEYLNISAMETGMFKEYVVAMSTLAKISGMIIPPATAAAESSSGYRDAWNSVNEVCFNTSLKFHMQGQILSAFEFLSLLGVDMAFLPRITEEEFYNLEA